MSEVTIKVDTRKFDRALNDYMRYSSRSFVESVNNHAYYVARNATQTTHAAESEKIKADLEQMSKSYPSVPLAAILVNRDLRKKGKKGLHGEKMRAAVEKFIRVRVAHRNFLRSGWIPAIKLLAPLVTQKTRGAKIPANTDKKGRGFGGATAAKPSVAKVFALLWNSSVGGKNDPKSIRYLEEGAQKAIDMETASMGRYIEKKQQEIIDRFWKA